jgi:hypothetical protein
VLPTEPGLLLSSSILLIPNASLSNIRLEPNGEGGSGWELCIEMDSEREVWFPSRSFDGGTSTNLVGGDAGFEADLASLDWIIDPTLWTQMSEFPRLKSV